MSWFSENYEKAALGAGALVAAGLVFVGWQKYGSVGNDFSSEPKGTGPSDPSVKNGDLVSTAKASYSLERQWIKGDDNGRPVDLFTGVALFVNKNDPTKPLDLLKGEEVHEGIPNQWWLDNRIDPGFGLQSILVLFSNRYRFDFGINPCCNFESIRILCWCRSQVYFLINPTVILEPIPIAFSN
mgnify:CR=1 FL=1